MGVDTTPLRPTEAAWGGSEGRYSKKSSDCDSLMLSVLAPILQVCADDNLLRTTVFEDLGLNASNKWRR